MSTAIRNPSMLLSRHFAEVLVDLMEGKETKETPHHLGQHL
jgi:hypothetical protein